MPQVDDAPSSTPPVDSTNMPSSGAQMDENQKGEPGLAEEPGGETLPKEAVKSEQEIAAPAQVNGDTIEGDKVAQNSEEQTGKALSNDEKPALPPKDIGSTPEHEQNGTSGEAAENKEAPTTSGSSKADRRKTNDSVSFKTPPSSPTSKRRSTLTDHHRRRSSASTIHKHSPSDSRSGVSEWSHQQLAPRQEEEVTSEEEDEWQEMPAFARYDMYDDDNKLIAREYEEEREPSPGHATLGSAAKGYTKVTTDEDARSTTSLDDDTAYLFKETAGTQLDDEDEDARDRLAQMQMTKNLLDDNQKIAYVGLARLALAEIFKDIQNIERTKASKKVVDYAVESMKLWSQKMMVRIYGHMELDSAEQIMIEQLSEHGLIPEDLTPSLMLNARVKNPAAEDDTEKSTTSGSVPPTPDPEGAKSSKPGSEQPTPDPESDKKKEAFSSGDIGEKDLEDAPPPYKEHDGDDDNVPDAQIPSQLPTTENLDIDIRWTVLCDLFLILIADSVYDSRSRCLLERVASFLKVPTLDICRFEKRITEALEMQEDAEREKWDEQEHMESRRKQAKKRRLMMMGLATVGGGLVIGLSAGLLAPVIGAGLAAGFTTIGVTGTSGFLAGAGGATVIGTVGVATGGTIGGRAANRRTGSVKTFEYRPLHNNKRVNLIVTVAGWMTGKVDDVRLPFSTVDPVMGDIYSVHWEPEMLRSMGDTINILATEALTQGLQQLLGSTILISLMAALQLPIVLTKLSYLIDNPWSVSCARADQAGLILADSLIDRNLGARPITLVGYSLGSRVIFGALKELANRGAVGLIQNVYIFGTPVVVKKDEYLKARSVVSGRFVNGYSNVDWILGYLFRATGGGISRVAGLAKVEIPGIENVDVTEWVQGHMAYRKAMPRLLRETGFLVESDEFSEIEDPDPENHEKRQRELINEIEEARKELEQTPEKRRFWLFSRKNKKKAQKKEWETYDETFFKSPDEGQDPADKVNAADGALFDIEALRREVVDIASHGIEVRELESTMPPMQVTLNTPDAQNARPPPLRETKSFEGIPAPQTMNGYRSTASTQSVNHTVTEVGEHGDIGERSNLEREENVSMSFEPPAHKSSYASSPISPNVPDASRDYEASGDISQTSLGRMSPERKEESPPRWSPPENGQSVPSWKTQEQERSQPSWSAEEQRKPEESWPSKDLSSERPLSSHSYTSAANVDMNRNVWADEDDEFGKEKEIQLSFE